MQPGTARSAEVVRETIRSTSGERVWVLLNHIKSDRREHFERFVHDLLVPAIEQVEPITFRHVRFLHPTEQNEDGSYTYIWLMDPFLADADYEILSLLKKAYGEERAQASYQQWEENYASPQVGYMLTQSAW